MPKTYRLRIRGRQRDEIDADLLAQALLMVADDLVDQCEEQPDENQPPQTDEDGQ